MAHRCGDYFGPENSKQALLKTLKYKPDIIEIDVRKSSDGVLFCYHGNILEVLFSRFYFNKPFKRLQEKYRSLVTLREIVKIIGNKCEIYLDIKDSRINDKDLKNVFKGIKTKQVYIGSALFSFIEKIKVPKKWKKVVVGVIDFKINIERVKKANIRMVQLFKWNSTKKNLEKLRKNSVEFALASWFLKPKNFTKKAIEKKSTWVWDYNILNLKKRLKK